MVDRPGQIVRHSHVIHEDGINLDMTEDSSESGEHEYDDGSGEDESSSGDSSVTESSEESEEVAFEE